MTRSGKGYKPAEKRVEKAMEREEVVKEEESDEPDDDLILEQLKKEKANVSIWERLMHSSSHRKALVKALAKMNIQTTATPEAIVAKVIENKKRLITFSDADLPVEGRNHKRALFIPAKVKGKRTSYMMGLQKGTQKSIKIMDVIP